MDAETQEEMTASLILNRGVHLAKWLQSIGLGHGDYISINSENSLDFASVPVATFLIGATFAPLNPDYTPGEELFPYHALIKFRMALITIFCKLLLFS